MLLQIAQGWQASKRKQKRMQQMWVPEILLLTQSHSTTSCVWKCTSLFSWLVVLLQKKTRMAWITPWIHPGSLLKFSFGVNFSHLGPKKYEKPLTGWLDSMRSDWTPDSFRKKTPSITLTESQAKNTVSKTEDMVIHIKRFFKWYSHLTRTVVCKCPV